MNDCCKTVRGAVLRDAGIREEIAVGRARQAVTIPMAHYLEELRLCLDPSVRKTPNIGMALSFIETLKELAAKGSL